VRRCGSRTARELCLATTHLKSKKGPANEAARIQQARPKPFQGIHADSDAVSKRLHHNPNKSPESEAVRMQQARLKEDLALVPSEDDVWNTTASPVQGGARQ
jgi:hypothetical protein